MYISLVLKACCPSRINYTRMESNVYSPRCRCCLNRMKAIVTQVAQKAMYIFLVLKACCPSRINHTRMESNICSPRYRCCLNRMQAINISLVLKRIVRVEQKATYVFVLKRVAHAKRKVIFVYLVLKRVIRVEKKATYHLHCLRPRANVESKSRRIY